MHCLVCVHVSQMSVLLRYNYIFTVVVKWLRHSTKASIHSCCKMASPQHKSFCILELAKCNSVITVQRRFRLMYQIDPPNGWNIRRWYRQFVDTGCVCKGKSLGRPCASEENVARIQAAYQALQNQHVVPVGNCSCLKQQFGKF